VARELAACRDTVHDERYRRLITSLLTDPARARDQLAARLHQAWASLVAPFWVRLRALLEKDIEERSRTLAGHGLRRVLGELHPKIRWTSRGLSLADRSGRTVEVGERGFLLMPSAYLWPHAAAIVEPPWLPTIIYPAGGIAGLWQASPAPDRALERLLGRTRAAAAHRPGRLLAPHRLSELAELRALAAWTRSLAFLASALAANVHRAGHAALSFGRPQRWWRSLRVRARSRRWAARTSGWRA
jgi:hypothetical protein